MQEIRRPSDGELCGYVRATDAGWESLVVFGAVLDTHDAESTATTHVLQHGLASLAERWEYRPDPSAEWQTVCIQEANPTSVRIALGYYSMPGVPVITVTEAHLAAGAEFRR